MPQRRRPEEPPAGRSRWAELGLGLALVCGSALPLAALGACAGRGKSSDAPRRVRMSHADRVAYGRPATCPDDAVDVFGDGRPGPDDLRCSYSDTAGGELLRLSGRVQHERVGGTLGEGVPDVTVLVREIRPGGVPGRVVARASTDPQGTFSLGVVLPAGDYELVLPAAGSGPPRASRRFSISSGQKKAERLDLVVPGAGSDLPP